MHGLKKEKLKRSFGLALDILFTLVLLFSISMVVSTLSMRKDFFGFRLGIVQSNSMEASDLYLGDVVSISKQSDYQIGDILVFYRATAEYSDWFDPSSVDLNNIWIHEVIDIKVDELGRMCYLTKGSSNVSDDGFYVPIDFVLGTGQCLPSFLNGLLRFAASRSGIIVLIILPCLLMIIYLVWELIMILTEKEEAEPQTESPVVEEPVLSIQYKWSFLGRLSVADDSIKQRYNILKNFFLSYRGVKSRISKSGETFKAGRNPLVRLKIRGKKIVLYYALDPKEIPEKKYHLNDKSQTNKWLSSYRAELKVKSDRGVQYAKELFLKLVAEFSFVKQEDAFTDYAPPLLSLEELIAIGYVKKITLKMPLPFSDKKATSSLEKEATEVVAVEK